MMIRNFYQACTRIAVTAFVFGSLSVVPARAQDTAPAAPPPPPQAAGKHGNMQAQHLEMMTKKLNLTSDQQAQIKSIQDDSMQQMATLRKDKSLTHDQRHSQMMDLRKSSQDKIRAVLTDEQKTKFDAMQEHMREHMKEHQQGQTPPQ